MEINVKYFLVFNGLVVGLIAYSMWVRSQKKQGPARLNLRDNGPQVGLSREGAAKVRDLNARFEFKGQNYDAYEVLDVPSGCSEAVARDSYYELRQSARGAQKDLLDRAWMEVRKRSS